MALDEAIFKAAMKKAQQAAAANGFHNFCLLNPENQKVRGFMQPMDSSPQKANVIINALFLDANGDRITQAYERLFSKKIAPIPNGELQAMDFQGMMLYAPGTIPALSVKNPYSNPDYFGACLIEHLTEINVTEIPYIFVPILNYRVHLETIAAYYQAALYTYAGHHLYAEADDYTRPYMRLARQVQLTHAAILQYCKCADMVAKLFAAKNQANVKCRLIQQTAYPHLQRLTGMLVEWIEQLKIRKIPDAQLQEFKAFIAQVETTLTTVINNSINYVEYAETNDIALWEGVLAIGSKSTYATKVSLNDIKTTIWDTAYDAQRDINSAKHAFNAMLPGSFDFNRIMSNIPESTSNRIYINAQYLANLIFKITNAIKNPNIRATLLGAFNSTVIYNNGKKIVAQVITDPQLLEIYTYVIRHFSTSPTVNDIVFNITSSKDRIVQSDLYIKARSAGHSVLSRSVIVRRTEKDLRLILIPNSKDHTGSATLPKANGTYAHVTTEWDITPDETRLPRIRASKSIEANDGPLSNLSERHKNSIIIDVRISRQMGNNIFLSQYYEQQKQTRDNRRYLRTAVRISEPWAQFTLFDMLNSINLYNEDISVQQAKAQNNPFAIRQAIQQVKQRFCMELAQQIAKMHTEIGAIHNDVKPENILVESDQEGNMHLRIADFNVSIYKANVNQDSVPLGTFTYISPQVYWLYAKGYNANGRMTNHHGQFMSIKQSNKYTYACLSRDLYLGREEELSNRKDYLTIKPDEADDMFALGITLIMLLADKYPTTRAEPLSQPFSLDNKNMPFITLVEFRQQYPQYSFILDLLKFARRDRLTAPQLVAEFNKLVVVDTPPVLDARAAAPCKSAP